MNVNREGLQTRVGLWADGASALESAMTEWFRGLEPALVTGARCNLSIWSNEYYLLAAVASLTVDGNAEDELVIDVGFHRDVPSDVDVDFAAEVSGDSGPPLAVMPPRTFPLDGSGSISRFDLDTAVAAFRSFSHAQSALVVQQLAALAHRR